MNGDVVISVLICTYNQEKFIASAIESALEQNVNVPIEILVSDDCSTDHTREIVMSYYQNNQDKIRLVFPEKNLGPTKNHLSLIKAAKGKYVAFLDGDDAWLDPCKLQKQLDVLESNPDVGMVCAMVKVWDEKKQRYDGRIGDDTVEDFYKMIMCDNDVMAPTMFFRKSLYEECVAASEWYIENKCFFDTIVAYWFSFYSKIVFLPEELAVYRVLPNSGCHTCDPQKQREYDKRYFAIKVRFLMENHVSVDFAHAVLMKEWDKVYDNAAWRKDVEMRRTKAFRIGKKLLKPIKKIKD
ncbi:MAG: glycosyltransferase [Paludibacteraceae bacterium]|nr:glycosyltransferase [Paludibacteraceae bacterium]